MHDEVSETENIRKNLAIERIIIGGCDILLDVNQVRVYPCEGRNSESAENKRSICVHLDSNSLLEYNSWFSIL